jgi:hypothetical protein
LTLALSLVIFGEHLEVSLMNTVESFDPLRFCVPYVESEARRAMIAEAAYYLAQSRSFEPGHELEDWLAAESEVDRKLANGADASIEAGYAAPTPTPEARAGRAKRRRS